MPQKLLREVSVPSSQHLDRLRLRFSPPQANSTAKRACSACNNLADRHPETPPCRAQWPAVDDAVRADAELPEASHLDTPRRSSHRHHNDLLLTHRTSDGLPSPTTTPTSIDRLQPASPFFRANSAATAPAKCSLAQTRTPRHGLSRVPWHRRLPNPSTAD